MGSDGRQATPAIGMGPTMKFDPRLEGMVNEARAVTCEEWLDRDGHARQMKKAGGHNLVGPCPKCGGNDRFGVNTSDDKWHCRHCGIGGADAISMVILLWPLKGATYGDRFLEACELVTGRSRVELMSEEEAAEKAAALAAKKSGQEAESARRREQARQDALKVWTRAYAAGQHVATYMGIRGLAIDVARLKVVRELPELEYWHEGRPVHKGPAMIACIHGPDDKFSGVHRTWVDPNGKKGKAVIIWREEALDAKKVMGSLGGGTIRLITPRDDTGKITATRMVVGEGIETTLTPAVAEARDDTAYWCAVTLGNMAGRAGKNAETGKRDDSVPEMDDLKCFLVPEWVKELVLLGDGDSDPKKTKAALTRAARRAKLLRPGIVVRIAWPGIAGDWNDLAMEGEGA
jgi:hypothetical protein